jgi:uncharacterized tellurite resistance protein B-like protein
MTEKPNRLTPATALVAALAYTASADQTLQETERVRLRNILQGRSFHGQSPDELLTQGVHYANATPLPTFLAEAARLLNDKQKLCVIMNVADVAFADETVSDEEDNLFEQFMQAFGIQQEQIESYVRGMMIKNDLSVLGS